MAAKTERERLIGEIIEYVNSVAASGIEWPWNQTADEIKASHIDEIADVVLECAAGGGWESELIQECINAVCGDEIV